MKGNYEIVQGNERQIKQQKEMDTVIHIICSIVQEQKAAASERIGHVGHWGCFGSSPMAGNVRIVTLA